MGNAPGVFMPLPRAFFARRAPGVARALLGCHLVHRTANGLIAGRVVEAEAYLGPRDGASHARRRTARSEVMWAAPGTAYVYRSHGVHACLNVVTEREGVAGAVLIRALEPVAGVAAMRRRRRGVEDRLLASGPGRLTQAMGISLDHNRGDLTRAPLYLAAGAMREGERVRRGPRIGITTARDKAWRFWIEGNPYVSR